MACNLRVPVRFPGGVLCDSTAIDRAILGWRKQTCFSFWITVSFSLYPSNCRAVYAGWIYDTFQNYAVAFFSSGIITRISACFLFIVPLFDTDLLSKERIQLLERLEGNKE